jgi:predicted small secreted protein
MSTALKDRRSPALMALALLAVLLGSFSLSGCNTVRGAGKDVENAGHAVKHAVD